MPSAPTSPIAENLDAAPSRTQSPTADHTDHTDLPVLPDPATESAPEVQGSKVKTLLGMLTKLVGVKDILNLYGSF
jgi:hypothetical protein